MSGILPFLVVGPQPVLLAHEFNDTTVGQAGFTVRWFRAGNVTVTNGGGTVTNLVPEWAGGGALSTVGDAYQVRLTVVTGNFWDTEFDIPGEWITMSDPSNPSALYRTLGSDGTAVATFEVRRLATSQIVASATWTFTWAS